MKDILFLLYFLTAIIFFAPAWLVRGDYETGWMSLIIVSPLIGFGLGLLWAKFWQLFFKFNSKHLLMVATFAMLMFIFSCWSGAFWLNKELITRQHHIFLVNNGYKALHFNKQGVIYLNESSQTLESFTNYGSVWQSVPDFFTNLYSKTNQVLGPQPQFAASIENEKLVITGRNESELKKWQLLYDQQVGFWYLIEIN